MKKIALLIILMLFAGEIHAQEPSFTASINRNNVGVGDNIQVTFNLENGEGSNFRPPSFDGFEVLMGPSTSQSMQIINGAMSRSISYTYVIRPKRQGKLTIDPAYIKAGGKQLRTNSITVNAGEATPETKARQQAEQTQQQQAKDIISQNLFVRVSTNDREVWQGEPVIASYKLYMHPRLNLVRIEQTRMPTLDGFWTQDISGGDQVDYSYENYEGVRYRVASVKKAVLLPQRSGTLKLDPVEFESVVRLQVQSDRRQRSMFDDFFMRRNYKDFPYTVSSNPISIKVKPLPEGAPASFSGGVGDIKMEAWLDKTTTPANEPVSLKIKLSGSGNLQLMEPPMINLPPDIESYEPKIADNLRVSSEGFSGNIIYEYILIPRNPGEFRIDPIEFSYFDLNNKKYITLTSKEFTLSVGEGREGDQGGVISGVSKEDIKYIGKDIRFIHTSSDIEKNGGRFFASAGFAALGLAPFLIFGLFIYKRSRDERLHGNQALLRNKKANKVARKHLATARKFMPDSEKEKFYEEVSRALWGYTSDKLGIPMSELTKDSARTALTRHNVDEELATELIETIEHCEFARFAPQKEAGEIERIYDRAAKVITELEGRLK